MKRSLLPWLLVPVFSALYQLFIKLAAHDMTMDFGISFLLQAAATPWMWAALISEAITFIIWMRILSDNDLSKAFPLSAVSYVLVLCIGWFIFHETILPLQLVGGALILAGVWFIGTGNPIKEKTV